jgi:hypothetical protein
MYICVGTKRIADPRCVLHPAVHMWTRMPGTQIEKSKGQIEGGKKKKKQKKKKKKVLN